MQFSLCAATRSCLFFVLVLTPLARPQDAPAPAMPTDAKGIMLLAAPLNSLTNGDLKPWHLKATYKLLDDHGVTTDEGTYEELWSGPNQFKRTYTGNGFTQTDYGTAEGVLRSGSRDDVNPRLLMAQREFVSPLPEPRDLDQQLLTVRQIDTNGSRLACVSASIWNETYCFDPARPIMRVSRSSNSDQFLHNRILQFQGHYLAGDLTIATNGKPVLTAHVESIAPLDTGDEAQFTPSADAVLLPRRINISAGVAVGMLQQKTAPAYPQDARASRVTGTVVLQATISTTGHIKELRVVSGPPLLQKAALDAVKTWRYRPYVLNGEPVEVQTAINVIFSIGG